MVHLLLILSVLNVVQDNAGIISLKPELVTSMIVPIDRKCHTQGIALSGDTLFISCVARKEKRAYLYRASMSELKAASADASPQAGMKFKDLTEGDMYHPSGMDIDDECLWVAAAQYHPAPAKSIVMCLDPKSLQKKFSFNVEDHIGSVTVIRGSGPKDKDLIVGTNWDSKGLYIWDRSGNPLAKISSPMDFAAQDCKGLLGDRMLCGGVKGTALPLIGEGMIAVVTVELDNGAVEAKVLSQAIIREKERNGLPMTNEAVLYQDDLYYFLPGDFPGAKLYMYRIPGFMPR